MFDMLNFSRQVLMHEKHYNRHTGKEKIGYNTSIEAYEKAKELGLEQYGFYTCPICKKFHVGHY